MRQKQMWRFYCDHCKKTGGQKSAMLKHESRCFGNPDRKCTFCDLMGEMQEPIADLLAALRDEGLAHLRKVANGCPACIAAAITQERKTIPEDEGWPAYDFDYAKESQTVMNDIRREEMSEIGAYFT